MRAAPADVAVVFCHMRLAGAAKGLLERHFNRFDLLFTNTLPSGLLLRKACWPAVGGYDESMRDGYEDWEFHLRLMRAGYRAIELPKPYYVYTPGGRRHAAQPLVAPAWAAVAGHSPQARRPISATSVLRLWRATRDGSGRVSSAQRHCRAAACFRVAGCLVQPPGRRHAPPVAAGWSPAGLYGGTGENPACRITVS